MDLNSIAMLGTYVPRQCGIATFTKDLHDAIVDRIGDRNVTVLAMDDSPESYDYPRDVGFQIQAHRQADYRTAAELLNINQVDATIVQHEFGIFGGQDGSYLLNLLRRLRMPIITTLHTVLDEPSEGQREVMRELARLSDRLVVMNSIAIEILQRVYNVPRDRIAVIPHGIPDLPFIDPSFHRDQFGLEGKKLLLTFGLLSPGKGLEVAIEAMPKIVAKHPGAVYLILGATHPHILKREGNAYRDSLERRAEQLGVRENVLFHNRYVTIDELCKYLEAADIYITPYLSEKQITSGTLAYAVGAGKAVVSTPYWHARELLADGRGCLFDFGDSAGLADHVIRLLDDDVERNAMRKRAYLYGRPMVWEKVAGAYLDLAQTTLNLRSDKPRPTLLFRPDRPETEAIPEISLAHLFRMTDDTGIFQHATYHIPDRFHGYCVDDVARALVVALMNHHLRNDDSTLPLADTYLSFMHHGFNRDAGRFRNFMGYDRRWLEDVGSEDVHGRAIWALGSTTAMAPSGSMLALATRLFNDALRSVEDLNSPRSWAFAMVGIHSYLRRFAGDTNIRRMRSNLAYRLHEMFKRVGDDQWPWCEDIVTYDNAKLPHALILSGQWIPDHEMLQQGLRSLAWLVDLQLGPDGMVSLIGNNGWLRRDGSRAKFDQQAVDAMALIEACAEAFRATRDAIWIRRARKFLYWFLGNNDTRSVLYDYQTGGCRDGLHNDGPNLNQGAESTLAWLISLLTVYELGRYDSTDIAATTNRETRPDEVVPSAGGTN
ncbi:MAG: glycosyltransferase family 4 protein [Phycisphaeraceae bacterium]|nr:glycosyltransferase family 4 protein [Phycisphaeraceae bacterium]